MSADKRQVCGEWRRLGEDLTGDRMKIYVGIDMAKDKFDYCAMDDTLNILCRGSNQENRNERFRELSDLIRILKVLMDEKENFEKAMKSDPVLENHVIMSIPGIGTITGSVILGKTCNINRFENAEKLVAFVGFDPVIKESGKQRSQKSISKRGDSALRSAIYQSTLAAVRGNPVISEFYHRKTDGGMPKKKALVAASRKQCHIIWSVWHNNKPFEIPEKFRKQD